jgi:hypothetical protein
MVGPRDATGALTDVLKAAETVRSVVNAIREAKRQREQLAEQICKLEDVLAETKAKYEGRGLPAARDARVVLQNLKKSVKGVELVIQQLKGRVSGLQEEMADYQKLVKGEGSWFLHRK